MVSQARISGGNGRVAGGVNNTNSGMVGKKREIGDMQMSRVREGY